MEATFFLAAMLTVMAATAAAMQLLRRDNILLRIASAMWSLRRCAIKFRLAIGVTVESAASD